MLQKYENKNFIKENFKTNITLFHSIEDRDYWEKIKQGIYNTVKSKEKEIADEVYAHLSATLYMQYERTGNRSEYEKEYIKRRYAISVYTLLEAMENEGKYTDKIIDLLWLILEETTWCAPAHSNLLKSSDMLPGCDDYALDHYSAETGALLGGVYVIMKKRFDEVSANISPRIVKALRQRITDNYLDHDDYWWMGFSGNRVNNWNPWVNSNVAAVIPIAGRNDDEKATLLLKLMKSLDYYADSYPDDGGCDEGPVYWQQSCITFMECLYALYAYLDGKLNGFANEKTVNMFHYVLTAYIGNGRVINFSDAPSKFTPDYGMIYKFAKLTDDKEMLAFSGQLYGFMKENTEQPNYAMMLRVLNKAEANTDLNGVGAFKEEMPKSSYIKSIQVMTQRFENGLYLAAKGGHNAESHNHNDVGNFIVCKNNIPFIADSGNMVYTKDTFSDKRYTIWTNVSEYHNLPVIGGRTQHNGREYAAENVEYGNGRFSLDIHKAYENNGGIEAWRREFDFSDGKRIRIIDSYALKQREEICFNFLSAVMPEIGENIVFKSGEIFLRLFYESDKFETAVDIIEINDENLKKSWGNRLYRIRLIMYEPQKNGSIVWCFE